MTSLPLLSLLVFTPMAGAALLILFRALSPSVTRTVSLGFSLSTLGLSAAALNSFNPAITGYQFVERHDWIATLNVHYHLGLDGMSLLLVLLTGIISPAALLASRRITRSPRLFGALFLMLQSAALGVFLALDFFHWFLFWELSLIPAYFLIKLWGGAGATRAAYQFFIYTLGGSVFMLLGFAAIFVCTGTLDFTQLASLGAEGTLTTQLAAAGGYWPRIVFLGVLLGLAVKGPLFPFHTWLPPAYAEAPTGVSMFLTGVMSKMGVYAFFRILWPIFPAELHAAAPILLGLALGGVVFGAFAAMKQTDLKRMVAYSSINHLSYCLLALFAVAAITEDTGNAHAAVTSAFSGALLQMFNHGLSAAALFFCVGVLQSRAGGKRGLGDFGGVRSAAPVLAGLGGIAMFSSIGLPGLNGFVGEFLIFKGVFGIAPWAAATACLGLFATAFFYLTFWQRVFHGPRAGAVTADFHDVRGSELVVLVPLTALMLLFGILPHLLTRLFNPLITAWAAGFTP